MPPPQAFISSYAPRLRLYSNSLITPVAQPTQAGGQGSTSSRTTKRGTIAINYAEDGRDDEDFYESEAGPRQRPTGLRSLKRFEDIGSERGGAGGETSKFLRETTIPVNVQGIWRDWMGKPKFGQTDRMLHAQSALPLTLIPIRVDLDIPAFLPAPALPLPAYRSAEPTPPYRLKDVFLWNLHETLMTPDQFALTLVQDLDLPNAIGLAQQVSTQIRQQLEEYAGVALHPLFHTQTTSTRIGMTRGPLSTSKVSSYEPSAPLVPSSGAVGATPLPLTNGIKAQPRDTPEPTISALATSLASSSNDDPIHSPDDTYRCLVTLNINLQSHLYTDKFEWSLLHPPGLAESFSRLTCADLGLTPEWVPIMTHAIYEAVLRLKKEACESGGIIAGEIDNQAAEGRQAGWRYDNEHLADDWEARLEKLSKEEIEKREGDRERQIRRLRRETARFSSNAGLTLVGSTAATTQGNGYFDQPADSAETPMGRGERSKRKRRFRSLSPSGRGTPGGRNTPDVGGSGAGAGYGGGGGLTDWERQSFRCAHCLVWGSGVWAVRDGPTGPRVRPLDVPKSRSAQLIACTHRRSATTAASSTRGTVVYHHGARTSIAESFPSVADPWWVPPAHPFRSHPISPLGQ